MKTSILLLTLFSAFLWGISPLITKHLLCKYERYTIMVLCSVIYLSCLLLGMPYYNKSFLKDLTKLSTNDILLLLFEGIFVLFLANVIYYYVLKDNNSSIVVAIESCGPFFTLLFACFLLNEKITVNGIVGIVLIVLGIICISYNDININLFETFLNRE